MKKKIAAIAVIIIILSLFTSGTLAYFTYSDVASNVITTGNIKIELTEKTKNSSGDIIPFPVEGLSGKMPGDSIIKIVKVKNTGGNDAYVRIKAEAFAEDALGNPLPGKINVGADTESIITFAPCANWERSGEYYVYKGNLAPGNETESFIEEVTINPNVGNAYQGAKLSLTVTAYAVQSANNGSSYKTASGWPA